MTDASLISIVGLIYARGSVPMLHINNEISCSLWELNSKTCYPVSPDIVMDLIAEDIPGKSCGLALESRTIGSSWAFGTMDWSL